MDERTKTLKFIVDFEEILETFEEHKSLLRSGFDDEKNDPLQEQSDRQLNAKKAAIRQFIINAILFFIDHR